MYCMDWNELNTISNSVLQHHKWNDVIGTGKTAKIKPNSTSIVPYFLIIIFIIVPCIVWEPDIVHNSIMKPLRKLELDWWTSNWSWQEWLKWGTQNKWQCYMSPFNSYYNKLMFVFLSQHLHRSLFLHRTGYDIIYIFSYVSFSFNGVNLKLWKWWDYWWINYTATQSFYYSSSTVFVYKLGSALFVRNPLQSKCNWDVFVFFKWCITVFQWC